MFGIIIGTACLIGLIKVLRGGARGHGGWGFGPHGRGWAGREHGGFGGGPFGFAGGGGWWGRGSGGFRGPGVFLRGLFERLDTTPGQEKVIKEALGEMRAEARKHRAELQQSRADVARAMRAESFDEVALGELFARHDAALEGLRKAATGALARVHVVLDERQRAQVADLIELGPGALRGRQGSSASL